MLTGVSQGANFLPCKNEPRREAREWGVLGVSPSCQFALPEHRLRGSFLQGEKLAILFCKVKN